MFCQCYFNTKPAGHAGHEGHGGQGGASTSAAPTSPTRSTRATTAPRGSTAPSSGSPPTSGEDFGDGELDWAVLYFDKTLTPAQREAIGVVAGKLFPVKWKSFKTAEASIDKWQFDKDGAHALLDGGKTAEVKLRRFPGMTNEPVVIHNLRYWGAPRNDGFVMMPNEVEAYRAGPNAFEFKGTNGFMITVDLNSKDFGS